jgi:hypothetical protein
MYSCRYESQSQIVTVKRDVGLQLNFTLKALPARDWSAKEDYGLTDNIDVESFTNLTVSDLLGFMGDNFDIIDHEQSGGFHHITMTDQVNITKYSATGIKVS